MHWVGLVWLAGKVFHAVYFILYRVAAWTGVLFLYRRGRKNGNKLYYILAVLVYLISWAVLALWFSKFWHWLSY